MYKAFFLLIVFSCISCKPYLDNEKYKSIGKNEMLNFDYYRDHNVFEVKHRIPATADKEIYYPRKFKINLPKNIKDWHISNNTYLFNFENNQFLVIQAGFIDNDIQRAWSFESFDDVDSKRNFYDIMSDFGLSENYIDKKLESKNSNRLTKLYTNSDVNIILFNVKKENYDDFLKNIKTFEYLN